VNCEEECAAVHRTDTPNSLDTPDADKADFDKVAVSASSEEEQVESTPIQVYSAPAYLKNCPPLPPPAEPTHSPESTPHSPQ
jgi:hypothetical protein